jgi:hypothetical protein
MYTLFWLESPNGRDSSGDKGEDGRTILKSTLRKRSGCTPDSPGSGQGSMAGPSEASESMIVCGTS